MATGMNWPAIRKILKDVPNEALVDLIKGLYALSPQNKAFIRAQISPGWQDTELLEKSRKQVVRAIYAENVRFPHMPRFGESRKVINTYRKATGDIAGTLDLMLLHVERGTQFTNDFGDIDEPFYTALETMLGDIVTLLLEAPHAEGLYEQYHKRLGALKRLSSRVGWGYDDAVSEMLCDLESHLGDA
jgi:hypothetical protein